MKFVKGMDLSTLLELERLGASYYDGGRQQDLLDILKGYDVDTIRLRVWNDPWGPGHESYGAGENDVPTTLEIAKRASAKGFGVLLDFHYSDFWTDPGKQFKPKAWEGFSVEQLEQAVHDFTYETIALFLRERVNLTMVQVGNELSNGMLWPNGRLDVDAGVLEYDNLARFVSAGIRAVREAAGHVPVMIHLDNGGNNELYRRWFDHYMERGEDFDLIGLSYYPFWHGSMDDLIANMDDIARRYQKDLLIAEVSMGFTMADYAEYEKLPASRRKGYATKPALVEQIEFPMTAQGQADFMQTLLERMETVADQRARGFFWWEPAWIPVPGSGWATEASLAYLHDPGPCGNEWANQALFDYDGNALPALAVIRDYREKN
jgi:arabinogalactan endo-1,4-beta-galactosidase